jgi:hypothetical protein
MLPGLRFALTLLACAAALRVGPGATAAEFRAEGDTIYLDGPIAKGDVDRLRGIAISAPQITRLSINSPGGDLDAGLKLGEYVRQRKLETYVEGGVREAASAAAYVFMGGETRVVKGPRGVGVHAFYTPNNEMRRLIKQKSSDDLIKALNEFERSTQESTMAVVEYVIKMIGDTRIVGDAVKSGSDQMLWPNTDKLIELKVATKKIDLTPDEMPTIDWLYDEVLTGVSAWLVPGYAAPPVVLPDGTSELDAPLSERGRDYLSAFLASEDALADLRTQLAAILERNAPPSRGRAREQIILPAIRSTIRHLQEAADRPESTDGPTE